MGRRAERTDPELWEQVKRQVTEGEKGGRPGQWSARKAQLAVQIYKQAGGGYRGGKGADNSLKRWQEEDWGTKSGGKSGETGERYLPRQAREALSEDEYRRTTAKKRADTAKGRQFSSQPPGIAAKTAQHREGGSEPTKAQLYKLARERDLPGRSGMSKAELARAVER
jgi:hypothetical protein